jgi:hypothetical protein
MAVGLERWLTNLTRAEVKASHWILIQKPAEVNNILEKWLGEQVLGAKSNL